jgi:hypothetical protein
MFLSLVTSSFGFMVLEIFFSNLYKGPKSYYNVGLLQTKFKKKLLFVLRLLITQRVAFGELEKTSV